MSVTQKRKKKKAKNLNCDALMSFTLRRILNCDALMSFTLRRILNCDALMSL
jgi:hypothetical protein